MCGIAGIIHRGRAGSIGSELTLMLQAMKHRGPDSTGFGVYGTAQSGRLVMRLKLAEQEDLQAGFDIFGQLEKRRAEVDKRIRSMGGEIIGAEAATEYAFRYLIAFDGDLRRLADYIEDVDGAEIMSIGEALELIKDLGDAQSVAGKYGLEGFVGRHAIGHTRMATESDVDNL